jgi:chlorite dismutase
MTKRSVYVGKNARGAHDPRLVITPNDKKYLFVYPFVKTRAWYALPLADRKRMMNEHIRVGLTYPSVTLNTTYSFGLDDQEFVVAFETDDIADFLDLVQELRESEASRYTLRDTPMFTCVAQPLDAILEALGA